MIDIDALRIAPPEEKIRSFPEMCDIVRSLGDKTVVLAQGVFDIVHRGHVGYLRASRNVDPANTILVVGIENDEAVRRNKGNARPINPLDDRLQMLAEFVSVSYVFAYDDAPAYDQPESYMRRYEDLGPAAIAVPVWDPFRDLKEFQAQEAGTHLALVDYQHLNSTSLMLQKIGYDE